MEHPNFEPRPALGELYLQSPAFGALGPIPARYTCDGKGVSPPLEFGGTPSRTRSLALVIDDPDAPRGRYAHCILYNIPPEERGLREGLKKDDLPPGARFGLNEQGEEGYDPPCPPGDKAHRYVYTLYALDVLLEPGAKLTREALLKRIDGHVLAKGELVGTYQKAARRH